MFQAPMVKRALERVFEQREKCGLSGVTQGGSLPPHKDGRAEIQLSEVDGTVVATIDCAPTRDPALSIPHSNRCGHYF
jgi:hypothetical protein